MDLGARSRSGRSFAALVVVLLAAFVTVIPTAPVSADNDVRASRQISTQGTLGEGYWLVATDGGIFTFGNEGTGPEFYGSTGALVLNKPIVGMAPTPTGDGYWLVASDGGIFTFGDAKFFGSTGAMKLNQPIVGMASTASGQGYYLVASDGGIFTFGDADFLGSQGAKPLNKPIVGMTVLPTGDGYYMVASDGGIFTFGAAKFYGSTGAMKLNKPIVGMAAFPDGGGYWLVATDGGIFTFAENPAAASTRFFGSQGAKPLNLPIVGMTPTATGQGYWMVAADGGIFSFGDAVFYGSTGAIKLNKPIVGMAAAPFSPITAPDFFAEMSGGNEVNPTAGNPDGDGDASGSVFLDFSEDGSELCYAMVVSGIATPTAAHIHPGNAGENGPVAITFSDLPDADGVAAACQAVDPALTQKIMDNPFGYYVNVHNADFPGGALRGQLAGHLIVGSTSDRMFVLANSEFPEEASDPLAVTGIPAGETVIGIDARITTEKLIVTTIDGASIVRLYNLDFSLVATRIGTDPGGSTTVTGTTFGVDWDPKDDIIRLVSNANENIVIDPDTGVGTPGPDINGATTVTSIAYGPNIPGMDSVLYAIDSGADTVGTINEATGAYTSLGALGIDVGTTNGFDIAFSPEGRGTALFAGRTAAAETTLWAIDLATASGGAAERVTTLGTYGDGDTVLTGLSIIG